MPPSSQMPRKCSPLPILVSSRRADWRKGPEIISIDSPYLRSALGCEGYPLGRVIHIYGDDNVGKTSLGLHLLSQATNQQLLCGYVDADHAFDEAWATHLGVDTASLLLARPYGLESALELTRSLLENCSVVVYDSTASLCSELERDSSIGLELADRPYITDKGFRVLHHVASRHNACLIVISQLRTRFSKDVWRQYQTVPTAPRILSTLATFNISLLRSDTVRRIGYPVVSATTLRVESNKLAAPTPSIEMTIDAKRLAFHQASPHCYIKGSSSRVASRASW